MMWAEHHSGSMSGGNCEYDLPVVIRHGYLHGDAHVTSYDQDETDNVHLRGKGALINSIDR
jgi:hypothetical protein